MEEFVLTDDIIEQIKDFDHEGLIEEQSLLIDKLILNEELKKRYKKNGLCKECKQPNTYYQGDYSIWCMSCNAKNFQQNFKNWTSGNHEVDKFIQKTQLKAKNLSEVLEWIEYDRFENIEYLTKGGFGTIYKAIWKDGRIKSWDFENNKWTRSKYYCREYEDFPVVLKCLHNSQDISSDFLRIIETHMFVSNYGDRITKCYGITKDPESRNFMIVMGYAKDGSLRQYLNSSFNSIKWNEKLVILQVIAQGLDDIHQKRVNSSHFTFITDLGLCRLANVKSSQNECKELYGVLPYVAPEVLRGKEYTQESDIYGFGIVAYEVCTGLPPYHDIIHDKFLAISICQGLRPKSNYKIPQLVLNIIKQCWDADPLKRPKANELEDLFDKLYDEKINEKLISSSSLYTGPTLSYTTNPQAVYTSRLLDFKNLPEPINAIDNKDDDNSFGEYSESIEAIDFTKLDPRSS
ncbi:kinase-like domain-containing protein [Rhizophagus irregularis DAOM 181602=DAOM 197198]|uniref:Kinase-like domain-containing protein n=1 Tax=Rhizophagus irregularis (strain DAOM 181602 / DAOM 197198 / MUCL 43194) TaxID=747089 RepID=A0A2P4QV21_RHIID|nr:kinase-like domain-containing protein [Rhizophagus irregularis DAOM 181602=DAOM 197198]POG81477.1 kinase-like domain-containing protein [Rhizophagus irregularis DAOM 181602=DAOM 197198]|eukprot:XP_025188343.1 kinase-like domain-containing protein [Rhizophagus irregularis DAOM 181602=DAOM 197198]